MEGRKEGRKELKRGGVRAESRILKLYITVDQAKVSQGTVSWG